MPLPVDALPQHEPTWIFPGSSERRVPSAAAADFLRELDLRDTTIVVLAYGLGLSVGPIARVLHVDPALVTWRLHDVLTRWAADQGGAFEACALEHTVTDLLRGRCDDAPEPLDGAESWAAADLLARCDDELLTRLEASVKPTPTSQPRAAGVGPGLVVLVAVAVVGFLAFGVLRDSNPLNRGLDHMRRARYDAAIQALSKVATVEARTRIVLCLLALGRFDDALAKLGDEDTRSWFGPYAPGIAPLPESDASPSSRAQLPRGAISLDRPTFVLRAGPATRLVVRHQDDRDPVPLELALPDSRDGPELYELPYPEDWPPLRTGHYVWHLEGDPQGGAAFDMADRELVREIRERNLRVLGRDVPLLAQNFLRGHHFANRGLLMQAGQQFARLAERVPDQAYPWDAVREVARALRVDPEALLR